MEDGQRELTEEEMEVLKDVFNTFDEDGGGSIDADEMYEAMRALGSETTKAEIKKLVAEIDEDDNGEIDFEEFVVMMKKKMTVRVLTEPFVEVGSMDTENCYEAFKMFDTTKTGLLEVADLRNVLEKMGEVVTEEELTQLVAELDVDGDGKVSFDEFEHFLDVDQ